MTPQIPQRHPATTTTNIYNLFLPATHAHHQGGRRAEGHHGHNQFHNGSLFDNLKPNFTSHSHSRFENEYGRRHEYGHNRHEYGHHRNHGYRGEYGQEQRGSGFGDFLGKVAPFALGIAGAIFGPQIGKVVGGLAKGLFGAIGGLFKGGSSSTPANNVVDSTITKPQDGSTSNLA